MTMHARGIFAPLTSRLTALLSPPPAPEPVKPARKRKPRPRPVFRSTRAPQQPVALLPAPVAPAIEMPDLRHSLEPAADLRDRLASRDLHPAPAGDNVPRWSPKGFPRPLWSDADMRKDGARPHVTKGGRVQLVDRRKAWQRKGLQACTISRCGSVVRMKRGDEGTAFLMTCGSAKA